MTTIAYRDGILAGDGYSLNGGDIIESRDRIKVYLVDKALVAGCGYAPQIESYVNWMRSPEGKGSYSPPPLAYTLGDREYTSSIFIVKSLASKKVITFLGEADMPCEYYAMGSGEELALGAMAHGASAVEAVQAAALHDSATGGVITAISLSGAVWTVKEDAK